MVLRRCAVCARSGLYNTQLSGSIPSSFSSLTALQSLCVRRRLLFALHGAKALPFMCPQLSLQQPAQWHPAIEPGQSDCAAILVRAPSCCCVHCTVLRRCAECARSGLSSNQLSGSIPSSLNSLTVLVQMCVRRSCCCVHCMVLRCCAVCARSELMNNQLSGSIPTSLGSLTALNFLCVRRS